MKRIVVVLVALSLLVAACGSESSSESRLPSIKPTETARPHATPTHIPPRAKEALPEVDWDNIDHMYAAMRPDYAGDVDFAANRNRYYIEATLELGPEAAIIDGSQRVRYTNHSEEVFDEIVYRLYPNLPDMGGQLRVTNVTLNGEPVEVVFEVRNSAMSVPVAGGLAPGESAEMSMDFIMVVERGINPERFGFENSQVQGVNWHPALSVYEGPDRGWWKTRIYAENNDPYYGEIGLYDMYITHADNVLIGTSGVTIETTQNTDGTVTEHIVTGPMRDNFILAGTTMGKITDEIAGTRVNVYFLPGGERAAEWVMQSSLLSLDVFNRYFGDYPYAELDVAETDIAAGGVEYPGIVVLTDNLWLNGSPTTELVTAHEIAHQWWYAMVGNNQGETPWLDESLTSFSEGIYWREAYDDNEDRYNNWLQNQRTNLTGYLGIGGANLTMNRPTIEFPQFTVGVLVYVKGRVFYAELEDMIGREAFQLAVQAYFQNTKYELTSAYNLMTHFEEASGMDLDAFFYEWVGDFEGLDPAVRDQDAPTPTETESEGDATVFGG